MINRLRKKLVIVTMLAVAGVLSLIFIALNAMIFYNTAMRADEILELLTVNDGVFPRYNRNDWEPRSIIEPIYEETEFESRYFYAVVINDTVTAVDTSHIAAVDENEALDYINQIKRSGREKGYIGIYRYMATNRE